MAHEITDLARKYAPWSISKAGIAEVCGAQFEHKYILRTPESHAPSANRVGTAAHKVLELRVGGSAHEAAKQAALDETPLTGYEMESFRTLESPMDWFMRKWETFCRTTGIKELLLEKEWAFTSEMKACAYKAPEAFFRGKVDLGVITKDDDLVVLDHKSGVAKDIQKDNKFKRQLNSYAVMAYANVEGLAGVRGGIHFLQGHEDKRIQWLDYVPAERVKTVYVPWLFNHINFCASHLDKFEAKPKLRFPCEFCTYQKSCSAFLEMTRGA